MLGVAAIAELGRSAVAAQAGTGQSDGQIAAVRAAVASLSEAHGPLAPIRQQGRVIRTHLLARFHATGIGPGRDRRFPYPAC
jgi:aminoglycoside/choline kinase family phosphotransferase